MKRNHHTKIHHLDNLHHPYSFMPLVRKFPQKASTRRNELELSMKGILPHLRPPIKLEYWKNFLLALIQLLPTFRERARYKAVALLNTKTRRDVFFSMSLEERSDWITYLLKWVLFGWWYIRLYWVFMLFIKHFCFCLNSSTPSCNCSGTFFVIQIFLFQLPACVTLF